MRIAKVPNTALKELVWSSLCRRMDPASHLVIPSWKTLMRETKVCRQRIANVVQEFTLMGWIKRVNIPSKNGKRINCYYELQVDRHDADDAQKG